MYDCIVYLRKELTTDSVALKYAPKQAKKWYDVQSYKDSEATQKGMARWPFDYKSKPTRRNKFVTLGCVRHRIVWLADATE